jgi:hypothetical protein
MSIFRILRAARFVVSHHANGLKGIGEYVPMNHRYTIEYRNPKTGLGGLIILLCESEVATEWAKLEKRGYVVTKVERPHGAAPLPLR